MTFRDIFQPSCYSFQCECQEIVILIPIFCDKVCSLNSGVTNQFCKRKQNAICIKPVDSMTEVHLQMKLCRTRNQPTVQSWIFLIMLVEWKFQYLNEFPSHHHKLLITIKNYKLTLPRNDILQTSYKSMEIFTCDTSFKYL